jgi:OmpA-OmpF porin, OOP family
MKPLHAFLGTALAAAAFTASAQPGYVTDGPNATVVTNPFGLCWKTGDWNPNRAVAPCDAVPVAAVPAPAPQAAAPTPPPPPVAAAPQRPVIEKVTLSSDVLFDFNKATLKDAGKQKLDELAGRIKDARVDEIDAEGHADRIGSDQYNQKLSEQRAQAVKDYLASTTGLSADKIRAEGKGEIEPVTGDRCKRMGAERGSNRKLVQCLQPDRRVEIEVLGSRERSSTGSSSQ